MSNVDPRMPYSSSRPLVFGRNVVATSQPLAAEAGLQMLRRGGNAVDAALAAAISLTVVEPTGTGIGSDLFAIVWDGAELHGLNASGRSPAALTAARFDGLNEVPKFGWDPVTVPGAVSGWVELSRTFGKLPFAQLFEPAVKHAEEGFHVTPRAAEGWARSAELHGQREEFARHFLPGGRAPRAGEVFRSPDQATTLQAIATSKGEAFYRGALATKMAAAAAKEGGLLTEEDLANHAADWVGTIGVEFGDAQLHEIPPNGQGIAALMALGMLRSLDLASMDPDGPEAMHLQIEAMKLAFADTYRFVSDPEAMLVSVEDMLSADYLAKRAKLISFAEARDPKHGLPHERGTVYLTAADEEGRMVSLIQSNYMGFGSGVVIPGTGIAMQNRGCGFVLTPGHPNLVAGGKRPFHTIIPAFLMRGGAPWASFGVMGGDMQPQGHLQVALRLLVWGQNPQAASDAPRWQVTGGLGVSVEQGVPAATVEALRAMGHEVSVATSSNAFGGAQLIVRLDDGGYVAGSDHRKDGQAVGY
ncbi:MAG: gamma-glutamyltransferase family protein [Trueperaceae bacterium]